MIVSWRPDLITTLEHWASRRPDCMPAVTWATCIEFSSPTTSICPSPISTSKPIKQDTASHNKCMFDRWNDTQSSNHIITVNADNYHAGSYLITRMIILAFLPTIISIIGSSSWWFHYTTMVVRVTVLYIAYCVVDRWKLHFIIITKW